jgi:membrane associated rhomboid family serine protease
VEHGRWWTVVTSAFVPSACGDAAWTLVAFWFFGRAVERDLGAGRLVPLVVLAVVVPHLVFLAVCGATDSFDVARGLGGPTAACAVYAAIREPHEYIEVLGATLRVRVLALVYLGVAVGGFVGWVGRDDARATVEVAGAALGALAARFALLPDLGEIGIRGRFSGGRGPVKLDDTVLRERVDALLEKVASRGMESLSESERAFLQEASKRYR